MSKTLHDTSLQITESTSQGLIVRGFTWAVPPNTEGVFAPGCEIISLGISQTYKNIGDTLTPVWSTESGIPDAPHDGKVYGRQDGQWVEVVGGESHPFAFGWREDVGANETTEISSSTTYYPLVNSMVQPVHVEGFEYLGACRWENVSGETLTRDIAMSGMFGQSGGTTVSVNWRITIGLWDDVEEEFVPIDPAKYIAYNINNISNDNPRQGILEEIEIPAGGIVCPMVYRGSSSRNHITRMFDMIIA